MYWLSGKIKAMSIKVVFQRVIPYMGVIILLDVGHFESIQFLDFIMLFIKNAFILPQFYSTRITDVFYNDGYFSGKSSR